MAPCILLVHPRFSRFFSIWQHPHLLLAKSQCFMVYLTFPGLDPLSVDGFSSFSASIWASTCLCLMWESQRAFEGREPLPNCQTKRSIYIHIYIYIMTYLNQWSGWGLIFPSIIAQFFLFFLLRTPQPASCTA